MLLSQPFLMNIVNNIANPFTFADWRERWGSRGLTSDNIGIDQANSSLLVITDWAKRYEAIVRILGVNFVNTNVEEGATPKLVRIRPLQHPTWKWMYATKVLAITGIRPTGKETVTGTSITQDFYLQEQAKYEKVEFLVNFETLPFDVNGPSDTPPSQWLESDQYTSLDFEPVEEALQGLQGSMKFAEGTPFGKSFPQTIGFIYSKMNVRLTWYRVPEDFIFENGAPRKLLNAIGKLNKRGFKGFDPYTLRCKPQRITRYPSPISQFFSGRTDWLYDVEFNLEYFNPENGHPDSVYGGHNLLPYKGDRKFYYATDDGTTTGKPIFETTPFSNMFSYVGSTDFDV